MKQLVRTARGAPAPGRRTGTRSLALLLSTALLATLAVIAGQAAPAGADDVTTTANLNLTCTANAPIVGAQTVSQALNIDIVHPDTIARNATQTIRISQPPLEVPAGLESGGSTYPIVNLNSLAVAFKVTSQFRVEAARTVGGTAAANVSFSPTGDILFSVPGPLLGGQTYTLPTVEIDVKAVGTVGTTGSVSFQSFNLIARATLPIVGDQNIPTSCPTPTPNPPLFSVGVGPGAFSTDQDPVTVTTNIDQKTVVKYGSTTVPGSPGLTSNPFSVTTIAKPDVAPGASTSMTLAVGARDWLAPYKASPHQTYTSGLITSGRDITYMQGWNMRFTGPDPAKFTVSSVVSADPASMTATYNSATNTITLARATGAAGQFLAGATFNPPAVTVNLTAVGAAGGAPASLKFKDMGFNVGYRSIICFIVCSNPGSTATSATTTAPANVGGNPVGTQPNNTVFMQPITAQPSVGSIGIAVPPATVADSATVGNNTPGGVLIDVLANDVPGTDAINPATVFIVDTPTHGEATVDPVSGEITYVPEYGTLEPEDGFTYAVKDVAGRWSNVSSVVIDVVGLFCYGPCSLTQTIVVDVNPDTLVMEQAGGLVQLDTVVLDGDAQTVTAAMQEIEVVNERGGTAPWDITGQLTSDFKTDPGGADCPASDSSTWYWKCVPGDNLGWEPLATVAHDQVPGDVAVAEAGAATTSGLRSAQNKLCGAPATKSGGTFDCGALVSLGVPASAGAGTYAATLTLTLA